MRVLRQLDVQRRSDPEEPGARYPSLNCPLAQVLHGSPTEKLPRIPSPTVGHTPNQVLLPKAQQHAAVDRATPKNGSKSPTLQNHQHGRPALLQCGRLRPVQNLSVGRAPKGHEQTGLLVLSSTILFVTSVSGQPLSSALRVCFRMDSHLRHTVLTDNVAYDAQQVLLRDPEVRQSLSQVP